MVYHSPHGDEASIIIYNVVRGRISSPALLTRIMNEFRGGPASSRAQAISNCSPIYDDDRTN